jgi:hypothetical protein
VAGSPWRAVVVRLVRYLSREEQTDLPGKSHAALSASLAAAHLLDLGREVAALRALCVDRLLALPAAVALAQLEVDRHGRDQQHHHNRY